MAVVVALVAATVVMVLRVVALAGAQGLLEMEHLGLALMAVLEQILAVTHQVAVAVLLL